MASVLCRGRGTNIAVKAKVQRGLAAPMRFLRCRPLWSAVRKKLAPPTVYVPSSPYPAEAGWHVVCLSQENNPFSQAVFIGVVNS